jgi:hypothetical protein
MTSVKLKNIFVIRTVMLQEVYTSVLMKTLIIGKALIFGKFKVLERKNLEEHFGRVPVNLEARCVHCEYTDKSFKAMRRHFETNQNFSIILDGPLQDFFHSMKD